MHLTAESKNLRDTITAQGRPALYGMWNAFGTVAALLVASAALIAAVAPCSSRYALAAVMLSGVTVIGLTLACFRLHVRMFDALLNANDLVDGISAAQKQRSKLALEETPTRIAVYDTLLGIFLALEIACFFWLCWPVLFP